MTQITLYGKPSYLYTMLKSRVSNLIRSAQLNLKLNEVQDITKFVELDLKKIPALSYKGEIRSLEDKSIETFLSEIRNLILKDKEYEKLQIINVPIDYSKTSDNALDYAKLLSIDINGLVRAIHVYHPGPQEINRSSIFEERIKNEKLKLENYVQKLNSSNLLGDSMSLPIEPSLSVGFAADQLIELSEKSPKELIVMGTEAQGRHQKKWLGSVSTKVAQESNCCIMIIPEGCNYKPIKNLSYFSHDVTLDLKLFHKIPNFLFSLNAKFYLTHFGSDHQYNSKLLEDCWNRNYEANKIEYTHLENGKLETLEDYFFDKQIDLIIIPRQRLTAFQALLKASFSKKMILNSKVPIMIINK